MKVLDLFETDEWSNQELTNDEARKLLYKKQMSACHKFEIMAKQAGFYQPGFDALKVLGSQFTSDDVMQMLDHLNSQRVLAKSERVYLKLQRCCDDMLKAKRNYEYVGGKFQ